MGGMKVVTQLVAGFGSILLFLLIASGIGLNGMNQTRGRMDDIVNDKSIKVMTALRMQTLQQEVSSRVKNIIMLDDEAAMRQEGTELRTLRMTYDNLANQLDNTVITAEGR